MSTPLSVTVTPGSVRVLCVGLVLDEPTAKVLEVDIADRFSEIVGYSDYSIFLAAADAEPSAASTEIAVHGLPGGWTIDGKVSKDIAHIYLWKRTEVDGGYGIDLWREEWSHTPT